MKFRLLPFSFGPGFEKIKHFYYATAKFIFAALVIALFIKATLELFRYELMIKPFAVPGQIAQQGYSDQVVAHRLLDAIQAIRKEIRSTSQVWVGAAALKLADTTLEEQEIEVPGIGLSLNNFIFQIRNLFGFKWQNVVSGDVILDDKQVRIDVRMDNRPAFSIYSQTDMAAMEQAIKKAARYVLELLEPLTVGLNYCTNHKETALKTLIGTLQQDEPSSEGRKVALILEGCALKNQGHYQAALESYESAIAQFRHLGEKGEKMSVTLSMMGDIFLAQGDQLSGEAAAEQYAAAIAKYQAGMAYSRRNGVIYAKLAKAFIRKGKTEADWQQQRIENTLIKAGWLKYQAAVEKDADNPWIYTSWAEQLAIIGRDLKTGAPQKYQQAIEKFKIAWHKDPDYALSYGIYGYLLQHNAAFAEIALKNTANKTAAMITQLAKAAQLGAELNWIYGTWGIILKKQQRYLDSFAKTAHALTLRQRKIGCEVLKVVFTRLAESTALDNFPFARYEPVIQRCIQDGTAFTTYYFAWGQQHLAEKKYVAAATQYRRVLAIDPMNWPADLALQYTLLQRDHLTPLIDWCQSKKLTQLPQDTAQVAQVNALCGLAAIAMHQLTIASQRCEKAQQQDPQTALAYLCLGDIQLETEYFQAAIDYYRNAVDNAPAEALYYYRWAQALVQLAHYEKALVYYQRAIQLGLSQVLHHRAEAAIHQLQANTLSTCQKPVEKPK